MNEGAIDSCQMFKRLRSSIPLEVIPDVDPSPAEMDENHHPPDGSWTIVSDVAPRPAEMDESQYFLDGLLPAKFDSNVGTG